MQSLGLELYPLLILVSLFGQNYAGIYQEIDKSDNIKFPEYYSRMRKNSQHRGVLLSMSLEEQNKACYGILSPQYFVIKQITYADEELVRMKVGVEVDPNMPIIDKSDATIIVEKLVNGKEVIAEEELFFICYAMRNRPTLPLDVYTFYVFSAFQTTEFHLSHKDTWDDKEVKVFKSHFEIATPPAEHEPLSQNDVEELYITIRQNIDALRRESPRYIKLVEAKDDIQALSDDEKMNLCASILATSDFHLQQIALDLEWDYHREEEKIKYNEPLHIWNEKYKNYKVASDNVLCRAKDKVTKTKIDYRYTRSYNNRNSVFFIENRNRNPDSDLPVLDLDSYYEKISVLMNAKESITSHTA